MNPALPLLILLSLVGLWVRRSPLTGAGAVIGLAGVMLLAPVLALPDGVASPAATLGQVPPWQDRVDPASGNPHLRDVTHMIQPWLLYLRHELREGRLPFWNPHQFAGTSFWSNGQSAPLFPLHLLFAALPLQLGLVLLPWLRFVAAGLGAWALARELGLRSPGALAAGLVFPLSGMLVSFLLFPMGNALALVPWVLLATERLASGLAGWPPLALAVGLQMLSGHPETVAHTGMLAALYLLIRGCAKPLSSWLRFLGAWVVGGALAAVHLVPLAYYLVESSKWVHFTTGDPIPPLLALEQMLRGVLPDLYGDPVAGTWWGPFNDCATSVYAGALALPLAAAGLSDLRRERRWLAVAGVGLFSLLVAYHLPGIHGLASRIPGLERIAHHRLILGVELAIALLTGRGLDRWCTGRDRRLTIGAAVTVALVATAWGLFAAEWSSRGLLSGQVAWTLWVLGLVGALAASLRLSPSQRRRLWPLIPTLMVFDLVLAHHSINPALPLDRLYPSTGAVQFLQQRTSRDPARLVGIGRALPPNAAMVYGLQDLRGDDVVKSERFESIYRKLSPSHPLYFQPITHWEGSLLDLLGVRWVIGGPGDPSPRPDWLLAYDEADARIWERSSALPLVRWSELQTPMSRGDLAIVRRAPGRWQIDYRSPTGGGLVVAEVWHDGWRGTVNGEASPVSPVEVGLLGVEVPAGVGTVVLRYRPPGLVAGGLLSALALVALLLAAVRSRERRRPSPTLPSLR